MTDLVKIHVHVPVAAMTRRADGRHFADPPAAIRAVIGDLASIGAGVVGAYDNVCFTLSGLGRYRATAGANPSAGGIGETHAEEEELIMFTAPRASLAPILRALKASHPYETPAIDVFAMVDADMD